MEDRLNGMTGYLWILCFRETEENDFGKGYKKVPQCKDSEGDGWATLKF